MRYRKLLALALGLVAASGTAAAQETQDTGRAPAPQVDSNRMDTGVETGVIAPGAPDTQTVAGEIRNPETASVRFIDTQGNWIGTARLMQTSKGILVEADIRGLPPGEHAFHIHQTGKCEAPSFQSAGDHYAPEKNQHGFLVNSGPHAGDMPNAQVLQSGLLQVEVYNPSVSLSGGNAPLLDADGSALVIHEKADDYRSQPSGEAGDRIACAVISQ
ncbi:MAG TPA: superoxide dismutase family protein [Gemmatimonadales bacterium]|nr:superoxide dismutase family protein [Gemmatimonadales bacterium]